MDRGNREPVPSDEYGGKGYQTIIYTIMHNKTNFSSHKIKTISFATSK
jgi:hypothetical protein